MMSLEETNRTASYDKAGVDIEAGNRTVGMLKAAVAATHGPEVLSEIGAFGGLYSAEALKSMQNPILVSSTDGVGTKVMLAAQAGRYTVVGQDIVNHCINDILVQGARPLFFLDYFASSKLVPEIVVEVVRGMAQACKESDCALLGGETAEMPGVYHENQFDVAGTIVGVVDRSSLLPKKTITPGDILVGLASSGPHTNGYSLIRRVFADIPLNKGFDELDSTLADALLAPHRNYLPVLSKVLDAGIPKGFAHITGGGFFDNVQRVLPKGCGAILRKDSWAVPPLFKLIQSRGDVDQLEMYKVFNMGIGMVAVVAPAQIDSFQAMISEETWLIGEVILGSAVEIV
ncbi:MAG: phosphoribosylformylglycinamidine cyclo-ligase [Anaerolineae bacterium]|nr:phosphoribosylformylglycinamidine cyclo-ligase [Anaerolineae bacterium]